MAATIHPSPVDAFIREHSHDQPRIHPDHLHQLALQVQHNLQFQHDWSSLTLISHSAPSSSPSDSKTLTPLPRPLLSGIPPRRVYVHPDEQMEMIKAGAKEEDSPPQREWVLPSRLRDAWSLKKFAEVFDAIDTVPPEPSNAASTGKQDVAPCQQTWRRTKRVLLATVEDDSTVVYYVVHDGVVKPRQN